MKHLTRIKLIVTALALLRFTGAPEGLAQSFIPYIVTYQGRLADNGNPASGLYDLRFVLYGDGSELGVVGEREGQPVADGLITVDLLIPRDDFLTYESIELEIMVRRSNPTNTFIALTPRQPFTSAPYALAAYSAETLRGLLPDTGLAGTYSRQLNLSNPVNSFAGNGSRLTSLNASNLFGTIPDARLDASIARDTEIFSTVLTNDGAGSGLDADRLDGLDSTAFWQLGGNTGSLAGLHFIGTRDNQPLELRVSGVRALRLESSFGIPPNVIGGASNNVIFAGAYGSVIGGGERNSVTGLSTNASILGGLDNRIVADSGWSSIGGGRENAILALSGGSAIAGGSRNLIQTNARNAVIGGGLNNEIHSYSPESTIAGGVINRIHPTNSGATIGGGLGNQVYSGSGYSTIAGGNGNAVNTGCSYGSIGGGAINFIDRVVSYGTIGGGYANTVRGESATIPGGEFNLAAGRYSFAAGRAAQAMHDSTFVWSDGSDFLFPSTASNQFLIRASGGVGIGLTAPQEQLHVAGRRILLQGAANEQAYLGADGGGGDVEMGSVNPFVNTVSLWNHGYAGLMHLNVSNVYAQDIYGRNIRAYSSLTIDSGASPATLRIQSAQAFGSGRVEFWSDPPGSVNEWRPGFIQSEDRGNFTGELVFYVNGTGPGNKTTAFEALRLSDGVAKVKVLTITGGADVAEPFDLSSGAVPKGAVVVIDEANPGKLKASERAYDHRVAGIVSGANGVNPGLTLQQEGVMEGGQNVALSGRVYVQADASEAPIKPGDLLTTSHVPGHAMKATDRERTHGAILGKAMTALTEGRGLVLVLVSLQ